MHHLDITSSNITSHVEENKSYNLHVSSDLASEDIDKDFVFDHSEPAFWPMHLTQYQINLLVNEGSIMPVRNYEYPVNKNGRKSSYSFISSILIIIKFLN